MLEDLKVRTTTVDGATYVNANDFATHLTLSTAAFGTETLANYRLGVIGTDELLYLKGMVEAIEAVVVLLTADEELDKALDDLLGN